MTDRDLLEFGRAARRRRGGPASLRPIRGGPYGKALDDFLRWYRAGPRGRINVNVRILHDHAECQIMWSESAVGRG
jgi:hypothetical protein